MSIVSNANLETKQYHMCQRCGGQLVHSYDDINCLQCGALHTEEGELVLTLSIEEWAALFDLQKKILKAKITQYYSI